MKSGADLPAQLAEHLAGKYKVSIGAILAATLDKDFTADYYVMEILGHGKTALSVGMLASCPPHPTAGEKYGVPSGPTKQYYIDQQMHKAAKAAEFAKLYGAPPVKAPKPLTGINSAMLESVFAEYKASAIAQMKADVLPWYTAALTAPPKCEPKYNPPVKPAKQGQQIQLDI